MEVYRKASKEMIEEITQVMCECFGEPVWVLKFFFEERFDINNCHVCMVDNKIVSVLHVIPSKIRLVRETLNGVYIYGACTLKEHRKNGYMSKLINYTHDFYARRGYECAFLVPGKPELVKFYEKLSYINFFKLRRVELSNEEICEMCGSKDKPFSMEQTAALDSFTMEKLRMEIYGNQNAVQYTEKDIRFASRLYELFSFGGAVSTNMGYGICGSIGEGQLKVRDLTCKSSGTIQLLREIYEKFPNQKKYIIETSTSNKFFKNLGKSYFEGMIAPLSELCGGIIENVLYSLDDDTSPYLGISLE